MGYCLERRLWGVANRVHGRYASLVLPVMLPAIAPVHIHLGRVAMARHVWGRGRAVVHALASWFLTSFPVEWAGTTVPVQALLGDGYVGANGAGGRAGPNRSFTMVVTIPAHMPAGMGAWLSHDWVLGQLEVTLRDSSTGQIVLECTGDWDWGVRRDFTIRHRIPFSGPGGPDTPYANN